MTLQCTLFIGYVWPFVSCHTGVADMSEENWQNAVPCSLVSCDRFSSVTLLWLIRPRKADKMPRTLFIGYVWLFDSYHTVVAIRVLKSLFFSAIHAGSTVLIDGPFWYTNTMFVLTANLHPSTISLRSQYNTRDTTLHGSPPCWLKWSSAWDLTPSLTFFLYVYI